VYYFVISELAVNRQKFFEGQTGLECDVRMNDCVRDRAILGPDSKGDHCS
jgi:hypothetical protein